MWEKYVHVYMERGRMGAIVPALHTGEGMCVGTNYNCIVRYIILRVLHQTYIISKKCKKWRVLLVLYSSVLLLPVVVALQIKYTELRCTEKQHNMECLDVRGGKLAW